MATMLMDKGNSTKDLNSVFQVPMWHKKQQLLTSPSHQCTVWQPQQGPQGQKGQDHVGGLEHDGHCGRTPGLIPLDGLIIRALPVR